jgi:hypothetical protein
MDDVEVLTKIVGLLKQLDTNAQRRILHSVHTFLDIEQTSNARNNYVDKLDSSAVSVSTPQGDFSKDRSLSPKEFMRDKRPTSDVERVACLAYFLAHYRDTQHFKTIDISTLNTEAAQPKFSNASVSVDNASKQGYLVAALKGSKQITAAGEHFVEVLPDRDAARDAMATYRRKTRSKKPSAR